MGVMSDRHLDEAPLLELSHTEGKLAEATERIAHLEEQLRLERNALEATERRARLNGMQPQPTAYLATVRLTGVPPLALASQVAELHGAISTLKALNLTPVVTLEGDATLRLTAGAPPERALDEARDLVLDVAERWVRLGGSDVRDMGAYLDAGKALQAAVTTYLTEKYF